MKYLLFIIFIFTAGKASGQGKRQAWIQSRIDTVKKYQDAYAPIIAAKDAYKYVGRMVIVHDSLYTGAVVNDSTITCQMGPKTNTPRLTLLAIYKQADMRFFNTFKRSKIRIWGIISGTQDAPVLILNNLDTNLDIYLNVHRNPR